MTMQKDPMIQTPKLVLKVLQKGEKNRLKRMLRIRQL